MDWKYIFSLQTEKLAEETEDELLNTIAWHDLDTEDLDIKKCMALLKISQKIMKYKSEQVEALVAELDDVATRQGEEEMKKQESEYDNKSVKSKKSSSYEIDELEEKYREVRTKLKLQIKENDKQKKEIDKLHSRMKLLENERFHLQNELQSLQQDDTRSELSETIKDQQKELIDSLHNKNRQISKLLNEIEMQESEIITLKEQLGNTSDKLADATVQINKFTNELLANNLKIDEYSDIVDVLNQEKEALKAEIHDLDAERRDCKTQLKNFALEIDSRVDEWKKTLDAKNQEIKNLKASSVQKGSPKLSITSDDFEHKSQIAILNTVLSERDKNIFEMQTQLQSATKEMHDTTNILNRLSTEKDVYSTKINDLKTSLKELKNQFKHNNSRCQEQQDQVIFLESLLAKKDKDLKEFLDKLKEDGHIELSEVMGKLQTVKVQKKYKEKQITDLVKANNELQESMLQIERENIELRSRLGLENEDSVCVTGTILKEKKQKKIMQELRNKINHLEEENLNFRLEVQVLNKDNSKSLQTQTSLSETSKESKIPDETQIKSTNVINEETHKALVEENEALRKGLHEILDSLQIRSDKGLREMKSETLEQLLRALDVKHISGWYHPAMRLQAELHTLQGSNVELREHLRNTRAELQCLKQNNEKPIAIDHLASGYLAEPAINSSANFEVISNLNKHLIKVLQENEQMKHKNNVLSDNLAMYKCQFSTVEQQTALLYQQHSDEKSLWNKDKETFAKTTNDVTEKVEILEAKLKDISKHTNMSKEDQSKLKQISEMSGTIVSLNRKTLHLENENSKLVIELKTVRQDLLDAEIEVKVKINNLTNERNSLLKKINVLKNDVLNVTNLKDHKTLLNDYDNLTFKHRNLLNNLTEICTQRNNENLIMKASIDLLKNEKEEIFNKLKDVVFKLNTFEMSSFEVDKATETLSRKVSQIEINEITERQRANHMTNLYELVKEQLKKSEERYKEFEKYNKDLMHSNLSLQEKLKEFQDKIINEIDLNDYATTQSKCQNLFEENAKLANEVEVLRGKLEIIGKKTDTQKLWSSAQEYEFLSLRHQIIDLQASTDDKAVISRLSSEVVHARLIEAEVQKKLDNCYYDLKKLDEEYDDYKNSTQEEYVRLNGHVKKLTDKNGILHGIIKQQREQYFGHVPMTSESKFVDNLIKLYKDRHDAFMSLQKADEYKREYEVVKEQLREQLKITEDLKIIDKNDSKITKWYNEKCLLQLQELKHRRKSEFVEAQLQQALDRIDEQDQLMSKLEEELLQAFQKPDIYIMHDVESVKLYENGKDIQETETDEIECKIKLFKSEETQTILDVSTKSSSDPNEDALKNLHVELVNTLKELTSKNETIGQLKSKQTELEMNINMFKNQIGDKQSQITFYEKHILELQNKKEIAVQEMKLSSEVDITNEELVTLKTTVTNLQTTIAEKESTVLKLQSLLKQDRDEHSLAAARMQDELKKLQNVLVTHQQAYKELKETQTETASPSKTAIEQYIKQVHTLENHASELHTAIASLESQLQSSREESVRWRGLANDRLQSMENLRQELETAHRNEVAVYRDECEKWRQEVLGLKTMLVRHTDDTNNKVNNVQKIIKERDDRIHELMVQLRQTRIERKKQESIETPRIQELESENEQTIKELDTLRKRHEQLLNREKSARDEIRTLKGQLMKRPTITSARSDKSESSFKEHLQKKINGLENEIEELREHLKEQLAINEAHRIKVGVDFEKWNKQKYWQQTAEKLKIKLKEKCDEFEKVQQTCSGYRILIERFEKEKHALENKNKSLRSNSANAGAMKLEILEIENAKLQAELEAMTVKLEMQQHHAGGLGAAMLQEKLEAQERKLAVMELATKGTGELRAELERLHSLNANHQKANLRLEAENLDFKLDLEKSSKELPHLREQIQHLENYIDVLKNESSTKHEVTNCGDHAGTDTKKTSELERTVFVLKRIVEKLQVENKRLQSGNRDRGIGEKVSDESLRQNFHRIKEQYGDSIQKIARLEEELSGSNNKIKQMKAKQVNPSELEDVKIQLSQKTELLDKVKVLLHRAAVKEKSLMEEITKLKGMIPSSTVSIASN